MIPRLMISASLLMALAGGLAVAQQPVREKKANASAQEPLVTTPEMWIYQQQLRRYDDPQTAVRRKAEFRAEQRQRRLAAQQWFGFSNLRPTANATPWGNQYGPVWISNSARPFGWAGVATPVVVRVPEETLTR